MGDIKTREEVAEGLMAVFDAARESGLIFCAALVDSNGKITTAQYGMPLMIIGLSSVIKQEAMYSVIPNERKYYDKE